MPRAIFNSTCDFVYGPGGFRPGLVYLTIPCRFVREQFEMPNAERMIGRIAYVNTNVTFPTLATVGGTLDNPTLNYDAADRLAVPSGSAATLLPLMVERVDYKGQPVYYRSHVEEIRNRPLQTGCNGCPGSPATWTISYPPGAWGAPFSGLPLSVIFNGTGGGPCWWGYSDMSPMRYQLHPIGGGVMTFETDNFAGQGANYLSVGSWKCYGINRMVRGAASMAAPPYVDVSCP